MRHYSWLLALALLAAACRGAGAGSHADGASDGRVETATSHDAAEPDGPCRSNAGCVHPPLDECVDDAQVRHYSSAGTCAEGVCSYGSTVKSCEAGTSCRAGLCLDPAIVLVDVSAAGEATGTIRPVWNRLNVWDVTRAPAAKPHPLYEEAILMTATGGRDTNEMYHEDGAGVPSYDFSPLEGALDRLFGAGIKPLVVIGNTPVALSTRPSDLGDFGTTTGSPKDYGRYATYIEALFSHLVDRYGRKAVEAMEYRLMTEPDNAGWWHDGWPEYQKLYDYTLGGMRAAGIKPILDVGNLVAPRGDWTGDVAAFLAAELVRDDFSSGAASWTTSGSVSVVDGQLQLASPGSLALVGNVAWQDYRVEADLQTGSVGSDPWYVGWLLVRHSDADNHWAVGLHANGSLELARKVGGAWQSGLAQVETGLPSAVPHRIRVDLKGKDITVAVDGVEYIHYTSTDVPGQGRLGAWAWNAGDVRLDNVLATSLATYHPQAFPRVRHRLSFSCYGRGQMGINPRDLIGFVTDVRNRIAAAMPDALLSVDEGQILLDENGLYLWSGDGTEQGAAWNAAIIKIAHDVELERYVQWDYTIDDLRSPSYNVMAMYQQMRDGSRVPLTITPEVSSSRPQAYLDAIAARHADGTASVLAFHFDEERTAAGSEEVLVRVTGLVPGRSYSCQHYRVDRDHSNFFTRWRADSAAAGIKLVPTKPGFDGSPYDLNLPMILDAQGKAFWQQQKPTYLKLHDLARYENDAALRADAAGTVSKRLVLPSQSVSYLKLVPAS